MKLYAGVTDYNWFTFLASRPGIEEVNFWCPSPNVQFKRLQPGEPFLFKLHAPYNRIAGGGFYVRFLQTPLSLAWRAFGEANGTDSLVSLRDAISDYRKQPIGPGDDPIIGCVILGEPFFLRKEDWIPAPQDWSRSIVQGKTYESGDPIGQGLLDEIQLRLQVNTVQQDAPGPATRAIIQAPRFGSPIIVTPRLGQGAFRLLVTDAYGERCAVTQERTLPVLEAAHIHPFSRGGDHSLRNGILFRSDLHRLFDLGYVTINPDNRVFEVSRRIREDFENGRDYYALHGRKVNQPAIAGAAPSIENLRYHATSVFR